MSTGKHKLDFVVEKTLLSSIEKQGLRRDAVVLVKICDKLPDIFGESGSLARREVQEHWNNLRRRSIRSYVAHLEVFGIAPGAGTKQELATVGTAPSDDEDSGDETIVTADLPAPSKAASTPVAGNKSNQKKPPSSITKKPPSSITKNKVELDLSDTLARLSIASPNRRPVFSPLQAMSISTPTTTDGTEDYSYPGSSKVNAIVIKVNSARPEANLIFDVQFVPRIEHNGWARAGYHIRTMIGLEDAQMWNATMDINDQSHSILSVVVVVHLSLKRSTNIIGMDSVITLAPLIPTHRRKFPRIQSVKLFGIGWFGMTPLFLIM